MIGIVMVRNESKILARCVESLAPCDQILVVDTGSDDDTVAIAKKLGCLVAEHQWRDSVSYTHLTLPTNREV